MRARPLLRGPGTVVLMALLAGFLLTPTVPASAQCEFECEPPPPPPVVREWLDPTLTIVKAGTGTGTVSSTDLLMTCGSGAGCGPRVYPRGTLITLSGSPDLGSFFAGWVIVGGATNLDPAGCGGQGTCTFNLMGSTIAFAGFSPAPALCHIHQHGGIVTGHWHHDVLHLNKHTHTHCHPAA